MKKISIQKNGVITNQVELPQVEADAWLSSHIAMGTFGAAAYSYESEVTPAVYESQEILDVGDVSFDPPQFEQVLVSAAVMETINVPAEYTVIEQDTTAAISNDLLKAEKIATGKAARKACEDVLDLIAGFNFDRELTGPQITEMQTTFSNAEAALRASRPTMAKAFISSITPDSILVTAEMKSLCLELLNNY